MTESNHLLQRNLFGENLRWARRQAENYHTEVLATTLEHLAYYAPDAAAGLAAVLVGDTFDRSPPAGVETQVITAQGILDLVMRQDHHVAVVEVKIDAAMGDDQLHRYKIWAAPAKGVVVLLCRWPPANHGADRLVRWQEIWRWCRTQRGHENPVARYIIRQLQRFLEDSDLAVQKIHGEGSTGWPDLFNLMTLVLDAMRRYDPMLAHNRTIGTSKKSKWIGVYKADLFMIGLEADQPDRLTMEWLTATGEPSAFRLDQAFFGAEAEEQEDRLTAWIHSELEAAGVRRGNA